MPHLSQLSLLASLSYSRSLLACTHHRVKAKIKCQKSIHELTPAPLTTLPHPSTKTILTGPSKDIEPRLSSLCTSHHNFIGRTCLLYPPVKDWRTSEASDSHASVSLCMYPWAEGWADDVARVKSTHAWLDSTWP